ncbi:hypothetical protein V5799_013637 [Amblyomma americanum]
MVMEHVSRRVRRVARSRWLMRFTRVHFTHPPDVVAAFLHGARASAISELDLNNCVQLSCAAIKACIGACVNLTSLKCVNTRLYPSALLDVTRTQVRHLTRLDWSLPNAPRCRRHARELLQRLRSDGGDLGLGFLQYMYVEAVAVAANTNLLRYVLKKCPSLASVHFHERDGGKSSLASFLLRAYVRRAQWNALTYTQERVPDVRSMTIPLGFQWFVEIDIVKALQADVNLYGNMTARKRPQSVRSCVTFVHPFIVQNTQGLSQLLISIDDMWVTAHLLDMAETDGNLHELRALTLRTFHGPSGWQRNTPDLYATQLSGFLQAFRALQELNLVSFHFETFFDCSVILANAGMKGLRSLSLPACAIRHDEQLKRLSRAPFTLRELDIRGRRAAGKRVCAQCDDASTCTSDCLESMLLLSPLERLTLCDLPNVSSLNFLLRCKVDEMRLCNLGLWSMRNRMSFWAIKQVCAEVRSLKLESHDLPEDLRFLNDLVPAPHLRRLCITTSAVQRQLRATLLTFVRGLFPALHTLHVHTLSPSDAFQLIWTRLPGARNGIYKKRVLSTDQRQLCATCDYTGLAKPLR